MPKVLIGYISAHDKQGETKRQDYRNGSREYCLKDSPYPHVFVLGSPEHAPDDGPDMLYEPCEDTTEWMVLKNQALFRYALDQGFDYCFRACDDTYVYPSRLEKANLWSFDYAGHMPCKMALYGTLKMWMPHYDYMHGGCGIWLSRKAMQMLVDDVWEGPSMEGLPKKVDIGFGLKAPMVVKDWDDRWIGEVLKGKPAIDDPRRLQPMQIYAENGISIYEDDIMFFNDVPDRYVAVHDPGVRKMDSDHFDDLKRQIVEMNGTARGGCL